MSVYETTRGRTAVQCNACGEFPSLPARVTIDADGTAHCESCTPYIALDPTSVSRPGVYLAKFSSYHQWCRASVSPGGSWLAEGSPILEVPTHCLPMPPMPDQSGEGE